SLITVLIITYVNIYSQNFEIDQVKFVHKDKITFDETVLSDAVEITKRTTFNAKVVGNDIAKLERFYFDNGFFDVEVDTSVTYNYEENNVIVKFSIKENRHYRINQLVYNGLENISDVAKKEIKKIELIKKGNFYNRVLIIQHTNIIADALQNNGYM